MLLHNCCPYVHSKNFPTIEPLDTASATDLITHHVYVFTPPFLRWWAVRHIIAGNTHTAHKDVERLIPMDSVYPR